MPKVSILMGSDSDLPIMAECAKILEEFEIDYELTLVSAHRTPDRMFEYAKTAASRGIKVIIAGAGGAAHVAGVTAALTPLPVIGVPIMTAAMGGLDSLYSTVQMPSGIPVATVAINGAKNAGILAAKILAVSDPELTEKLVAYQESLNKSVKKKAERLEGIGFREYLSNAE
ncbi:MAG: 5-(carboxyamino)imidazole ribonucleotide mutase [Eubacterium sp.]|nr:5-(carboxyamino)imidazole ribonucleotide mutase [Eubacterium sp.]MCD7854744.1 5-(carboxyamino)imidazole ribonucleotide mutase [Clostridiales bacterium]MCD8238606.1 5-(carboxyamino)imidazole ribonucleotide mutase [Clostridiales bacterium]